MTAHIRPLLRCAALAMMMAGRAGAQDLPDPAVCAQGDQWIEVAKAFIIALPQAHTQGRISDQQFTDLSIWTTEMQTYLIQTDNSRVFCEQFLAVRRAWGF